MDVIVDPPTEQYATFPHQGIASGYGFDIDLMKRSMDVVSGPENVKKARWNNGQAADPSTDARYSNYGYGPGANQALYTTGMNQNIGLNNMGLTLNGQQNGGLSINTMNGAQGQMQSSGSASGMPPSPIGGAGQAYLSGLGAMNGGGFGYGNGMGMNGMGMGMGMGMNGLNNMGLMGMNGMGMGFGMNGMGMGTQGYAFSPAAATFQQAGQRPNQLSVPGTTNNFSVAAAAAAAAANNQTGRTVYVGSLPADASVDELLNLVRFGPLESVRVLPEKSCVFISFLDGATAAAFHADASVKKLALHGQELKIGWGKPSPVPSQVMLSIQQSNASRNVYLGGLDENMSEEQLRDDLSRFGLIDQVKIVRDKNIGFVHFLSISVATKVVATLPTEPAWAGKRVNYGKDRCAYVPKSQQTQGNAMATAAATAGLTGFTPFSPLPSAGGFGLGIPGFESPTSPAFAMAAAAAAAAGSQMNRTVYLGNIHPETTSEDLCNAIRGGVLQSIRYMQDKHIAFVTFVDATSAFTFYQVATYQGMTLNNRRLKIGWGKNSGPLPPALAIAVHSGATRNVYIGNIEDFENFSEEKLRRDFEEFGDIELINFLKEKGAAFINFTNIASAIKAIDAVKNREPYSGLRVSYGKDRCANAPRTQSSVRPRNGGHSPSAATMDGDDLAHSPSIKVENIDIQATE